MLRCNRAIIEESEKERESERVRVREKERKRERARKSKLASLKNKDKKSKMIGKRENEETVGEVGNRCAEKIEKKLHTISARKSKKTPDYCIIYIFEERCDTRILSIKKKDVIEKRGN